MNDLFKEIRRDIIDLKSKNFEFIRTKEVPSRDDTSLTFDRGIDKVGKEMKTCVLFVDIRDSVDLNSNHHIETMGRIYTAFSKSILKLAKHHKGFVRNIIGDRVMVVFREENCFTNSVDCAISINQTSNLINQVFTNVNFKCGIGIDYGKINIIKVGVPRKGIEKIDNKNLVWIGEPANIASRLTDTANKTTDTSKVKVKYYPYNLFNIDGLFGGTSRNKLYSDIPYTKIVKFADFTKEISFNESNGISFNGGRLIRFDKIKSSIEFPPILLTKKVFLGFKTNNKTRKSIMEKKWEKIENHDIKNVHNEIYGANLIWVKK